MGANLRTFEGKMWDVHVVERINVENTLHLKADFTDDDVRNFMKCGEELIDDYDGRNRNYIITNISSVSDGTNVCEVTAEHVFYYKARKKFFVNTEPYVGLSVANILGKIFNAFETGQEFTLDDCTIYENIDLLEQSKKTMFELIEMVLDTVGYGEIWLNPTDSYHVEIRSALSEDISKNQLRIDKNCMSIERTSAANDIVNRLYGFGANDLDITSITRNQAYIESEDSQDQFGVLVGYKTWSNITDPSELRARMQWEFSRDNPNRIDMPKVSYNVKYVDLEKFGENAIDLGDFVTVSAEIVEKKRIIELDKYLFEPQRTNIVLGDPTDALQWFRKQKKNYNYINNKIDETNKGIDDKIKKGLENLPEIPVKTVEASVVKSEVVSSLFCMSRFAISEYLETNFDALDVNKPYQAKREYTRIYKNGQVFIEADMSATETESYKDRDGKQLYWTKVSGTDAFTFMTYVSPLTIAKDLRPEGISDAEFIEMYRVKVRKTEKEYIKATWGFPSGSGTGEPELTLGAGDENGNGRLIIRKTTEQAEVYYKSRTDEVKRGVAIRDDKLYQIEGANVYELRPVEVVESEPESPVDGHIYYIKGGGS